MPQTKIELHIYISTSLVQGSKYCFGPSSSNTRSIRVLKTNRAVGLDKIGARLLKDSVDVITPSLTNLEIIVNFNKMLETLIFQRSYARYLY